MVTTNHHLPSLLLRSHSMAQWEKVEGIHITGGLWPFLSSAVPLEKPVKDRPDGFPLSTLHLPAALVSTLCFPDHAFYKCTLLPTEWKQRKYYVFNQRWPRNGWREGRGSETFGNEERAGTWSRVKPFMMCLGPELLASYVYWSPRICKGWEVPPLPVSPSANWHSSWLGSSWEHHLWSPLECFSSIFKSGMRKKFIKARVWLAVEAEVPFGGSIWKSSPPATQVCVKELGGQQCQDRARPGVPCLPRNGPGGKVSPVIIKLLLTREHILPCTFQSSVLRIRESTKGPSFLGDTCALQLALWSTQ